MRDKQLNLSPQPDHGPSRREFLTRAGMLAGGMALLGIPGFGTRAEGGTVARETFAGGQFALELDGQFVDFLKSAAAKTGPEVKIPTGPEPFVKKHIVSPKYTDITLQMAPPLPKPLHRWIDDTLNMTFTRHDGAIITISSRSKEQSRLQFSRALISEVIFPACDAASRTPGYLTITLAPEFTTLMTGKGASIRIPPGAKNKTWLPSNFRLRIQGLEEACSRVSRVDSLTIKQHLTQEETGQMSAVQREPTKLEFPQLVITVPESHAGPFYAWLKDFANKGIAGHNRERPGALDLLAPNRKTVLIRVLFHNLGIISVMQHKREGVVDSIRRVKVEMYCERMTLA